MPTTAIFVSDAFGSAHRAHASTVGVALILPAYAGLLLERELEELGKLLGEVERPFVLVSGGAKVEDKLVLRNLGGKADEVLIGGKMAEEVRTENPLEFSVVLPRDVVAASAFDADAETKVVPYDELRSRGGSVSTSARRHGRTSARAFGGPRPCSGTDRWACSSGSGSLRARRRWRRPSRTSTVSRSWAAPIRCGPCTSWVADRVSWSRPAAERHWSFLPREVTRCGSHPGGLGFTHADRRQLEDVQDRDETGEFCRALRMLGDLEGVDVAVCPPFTSLAPAVQALADTEIAVAAERPLGARGRLHGEISAPMLVELGVYGAIVGHSERRQYFGETDEAVGRRRGRARGGVG